MAVVTGEDDHLFASRMALEDRTHFLRQENRAAPVVRNAHGFECGVQMADAAFEPAEAVRGLAPAHIVVAQIARGVFDRAVAEGKTGRRAEVSRDKACAEDYGV